MPRVLRWAGVALGTIVALCAVALAIAYGVSARTLGKKYDVGSTALVVPEDSASIARGAHLVKAVTSCSVCHGADGGGLVYSDAGPIGIIAGPNLTGGRGGRGAALTNDDWVRALRYGVRANGTSLMVMPSEVFTRLSDADMGAIIAYFKQLPPVDREVPPSEFRVLGRVLLALGKLNILVAPKTPRLPPLERVEPDTTAAYGRYLADVAGCHGCHGFGLSGGKVAGPPGLPPASNLTPLGSIGRWQEADFVRVLRTGKRPDGSTLDEFMPWRTFGNMTDDEMHALWVYLKGVPAKEFGNK